MYRKFIKRSMDMVCAALLLVGLVPVFLLLSIFVAVCLGRPILFRQVRPGHHGMPFYMVKFRTMTDACDGQGELLSDEQRLTRFGKFLRATSLDELPELWNVLRGDMSLVGPRPLLMEYLPLYTQEQARRHELRPGITGWAQVNGRNALTWSEKFKCDVWYVNNYGFWLDMKILCLTIRKVLCREGITQAGFVTTEKFTGQCNCTHTGQFRKADHHHA